MTGNLRESDFVVLLFLIQVEAECHPIYIKNEHFRSSEKQQA